MRARPCIGCVSHLDQPTLDIFLSHTHLDHVIGLTFLFDVLFEKQVDRVRVHGEAGKLAALREHLFSESLFPAQPPIEWQPLAGPLPLPHQGELTYFPLDHPGGSLGYRLDWPQRSLAYVTDTTAKDDAAYVDKIRGVDVLIHECYFPRRLGRPRGTDRAQLHLSRGAHRAGRAGGAADSGAHQPLGRDG